MASPGDPPTSASATPLAQHSRPTQGNRRRWVETGAIVICGIVLGLGSVWLVLKSERLQPWVHAGAWRTTLLAGSADADMYTRARVAAGALLALGRDETLYYLADRDDEGEPLRSACAYRVEGEPPVARWWSITAYADDHYLFANDARRYSLNGGSAMLDARGRFALVTGPGPGEAAPGHWLPTPGDRGLVLALRLYNPDPALVAAPAKLVPPGIRRTGECAR